MFQGASQKLKNQDPIRVTNHKDPVSDETRAVLNNTKVWRMEYEFYNFARKIFEQVTLNFIFYFEKSYSQKLQIKEYANTFKNGKVKGQGYFYEKVYGPQGKIIK